MIDTATNTVVATVTVGTNPFGVAITPDGKHAYVANDGSNNVSVIDTASNTRGGATIPVGMPPMGSPSPRTGNTSMSRILVHNTVSVIDTATNTVEAATVAVGSGPVGSPSPRTANTPMSRMWLEQCFGDRHGHQHGGGGHDPGGDWPLGVAVTPDGKHAYVTNTGANTVSVIDTASNTVAATVPVGSLSPWGRHHPGWETRLCREWGSGTVSVIDTASNTVVATVAVGSEPLGVGIVPPPPGVPFLAFSATRSASPSAPFPTRMPLIFSPSSP